MATPDRPLEIDWRALTNASMAPGSHCGDQRLFQAEEDRRDCIAAPARNTICYGLRTQGVSITVEHGVSIKPSCRRPLDRFCGADEQR